MLGTLTHRLRAEDAPPPTRFLHRFLGLQFEPMEAHDQPDPRQLAIFNQMTPHQKLALIGRLRDDALRLKAMWLRQQHPNENEEQMRKRLRSWQLYGRADLD
jgi:hypothetical protein